VDPSVAGPWSDIGRTWAKVGLNMGKVALETSIETLRTAADTLDKLSRAADAGRVPPCCVEEPSEAEETNGTQRGNHTADAGEEAEGTTRPAGEPAP
jgi:hypothetical protein